MTYTPAQAQDKVLSLLSEVNRPGIDKLIGFMKSSSYFTTARCYKHHRCNHGLLMHSLEVLDVMLKYNVLGLPRESLILTALCHDLGKAWLEGKKVVEGGHGERSVYILDQCGVKLTEAERTAIKYHHGRHHQVLSNPLKLLLNTGDCLSTRLNKRKVKYSFTAL